MTMRQTIRAGALAALVGLFLPGCASAPRQRPVEAGPVDTGPMTLASARRFLEGRWILESFVLYENGQPVTINGTGTLSYDNMSNLRMDIRADQASADKLRALGIDLRDGIISTDGRTAIDLQNRTLTYFLEKQAPLIRGPLGMHRPRYWEVDETTLTLTTKDDAGQPLSVGRWKRM
jgi:hypothetical protein